MASVVSIGPKRPVRVYICEHRKDKHLTQQRLADRLNVTKGTISKWETGKLGVDLDVLAAICEALDIPPTAIYHPPKERSIEAAIARAPKSARDEILRHAEYVISKLTG